MSTYIVAFGIVGDFGHLSNMAGNFSIWSRKSAILDGSFGLEEGQTYYKQWTDFTGVDIGMLKMDLLAIPEIWGAMENWGLIIFT